MELIKTDPTDPAFPSVDPPFHTGLTKRELFAAMAMQETLAPHVETGEAE